jgi:hypothetical protein
MSIQTSPQTSGGSTNMTTRYVDGFVIAVPRERLKDYDGAGTRPDERKGSMPNRWPAYGAAALALASAARDRRTAHARRTATHE